MGHLPHPDIAQHTIVLVGADSDFWQIFTASPEYRDGTAHPLDRWSKRVLRPLAQELDGSCVFPSDGPPYAPFIAWARASGRFWQSPTGMLVHDRAGLMVSIRGALELPIHLPQAHVTRSPCTMCKDQPCARACPVGALSDTHAYDVPRCKAHIGSPQGNDCMTHGCATRRLCPLSQSFDRQSEQSAFHMRAFRGN